MSQERLHFSVGSFRVTVSRRPRSQSEGEVGQPYFELVGETPSPDPLRASGPEGSLPAASQQPFLPPSRGPVSRASPASPVAARSLSSAHSDPLPASGPRVSRRGAFAPARPSHQQTSPEPSSSPSRVPEYPLRAPGLSSRVLASFPPLTPALAATCRNLRGGHLTHQQRAERAWLAGCWAKAVKDGLVRYPDKSGDTGLSNRYYAVIQGSGVDSPAVYRTYVEYSRVVHFRASGLSISHAFPSEMAAEANEGLGPSTAVLVKSVSLDEEGEWGAAPGSPEVPALVIDLPAAFASALSPLNFSDFGGLPFVEEDFSLFPLAADVLLQARDWVAIGLGESRSGYQTGVSEPPPVGKAKAAAKKAAQTGKPLQASPRSRQP